MVQRSKSYGAPSSGPVTDIWDGLSGFGSDEVYEPRRVKRSMSGDMKRAMQSLEYSEADLEMLAGDSRQFAILKKSLRNKGAITNEVLKQKLPLYIKYKKDRLAQTHPEVADAMRRMPQRTRSTGRMERAERTSFVKPVNRVLSDEEKYDAEEPATALASLGRILRPQARRSTPRRSSSAGAALKRPSPPERASSTGSANSFGGFGHNSLKDLGFTFSSS